MSRTNKKVFDLLSLAASSTVASTPEISIGPEGYVALQVFIDNGAGAAPSDTPVGVFELHCSGDGTRYTPRTNAAIVAELALVAPNGNNVVDAWAVIPGVPGTTVKLRYVRTSGGGTDARATVHASTW
jgi:hypothetical protein